LATFVVVILVIFITIKTYLKTDQLIHEITDEYSTHNYSYPV